MVAFDTAENALETAVEEVDAADVSNKDSKGLKRRGEQYLEVRKALEMPMQDTNSVSRERERVLRQGALGAGYIQSEREF